LPRNAVPLDACRRNAIAAPDIAVLGDSHAEAVYPGLADALPGHSVLLLGQWGCPPLRGVELRRQGDPKPDCFEPSEQVLALLQTLPSVQTVVVVARGPVYISGEGFGHIEAYIHWSLNPVGPGQVGRRSARDVYRDGLTREVQAIQALGKKVVLLLDVPELGFSPASCVLGRPLGIRPMRSPCAIPRAAFQARNAAYRSAVTEVVNRVPGVVLFDASSVFCDSERCRAMDRGRLLYADDDHLSLHGSQQLAAFLGPVVERTVPRQSSR
jgi:hypothetical protein